MNQLYDNLFSCTVMFNTISTRYCKYFLKPKMNNNETTVLLFVFKGKNKRPTILNRCLKPMFKYKSNIFVTNCEIYHFLVILLFPIERSSANTNDDQTRHVRILIFKL